MDCFQVLVRTVVLVTELVHDVINLVTNLRELDFNAALSRVKRLGCAVDISKHLIHNLKDKVHNILAPYDANQHPSGEGEKPTDGNQNLTSTALGVA